MMGGHHAISGAAAWLAATGTAPALTVWAGLSIPASTGLAVQTPEIALLGALVVAGWALVADIDHHSATIAHSIPVLGRVLAGGVEEATGGHRHGTHTIWAGAVAVAAAWFAGKFVWDTGTTLGTVSIGLIAITAPAVAFATHSIKFLHVRSWLVAWAVGTAVAIAVAGGIRTSFSWILPAVAIGYLCHLAGDFLTAEGIAPLLPWAPKPPKKWDDNRLIGLFWHDNGYMSLPILGKTGSAREWALALVLTGYALYVGFYEVLAAVGTTSVPHL